MTAVIFFKNMQNKVKKINVPYVNVTGSQFPENVSSFLENLKPVDLNENPWPDFSNSISASVVIAHNGSSVFLKYKVTEHHLLAKASTNGNIYEDSCVEFFVDLDNNGKYYNLEFNCLGWGKIAYGEAREGRELLNSALVELIESYATISSDKVGSRKVFSWDIILKIPLVVFCHSNISSFAGINGKANFYKCGDSLPEPHYLVWNPIDCGEPDFHRPECFGELEFSEKMC